MNAQQKARGRRVVEGLQVDVHVNDHHRGGVEMYMHPVSRCLHYYKFKTEDIFFLVQYPVETLLPRAGKREALEPSWAVFKPDEGPSPHQEPNSPP